MLSMIERIEFGGIPFRAMVRIRIRTERNEWMDHVYSYSFEVRTNERKHTTPATKPRSCPERTKRCRQMSGKSFGLSIDSFENIIRLSLLLSLSCQIMNDQMTWKMKNVFLPASCVVDRRWLTQMLCSLITDIVLNVCETSTVLSVFKGIWSPLRFSVWSRSKWILL